MIAQVLYNLFCEMMLLDGLGLLSSRPQEYGYLSHQGRDGTQPRIFTLNMGSTNWNSGPHACLANTRPPKLSPDSPNSLKAIQILWLNLTVANLASSKGLQ